MQAKQLTDDKMLVTEGAVRMMMDIGPIDKRAIDRRAAILAANTLPVVAERPAGRDRAGEIEAELATAKQQEAKKP